MAERIKDDAVAFSKATQSPFTREQLLTSSEMKRYAAMVSQSSKSSLEILPSIGFTNNSGTEKKCWNGDQPISNNGHSQDKIPAPLEPKQYVPPVESPREKVLSDLQPVGQGGHDIKDSPYLFDRNR